MLTDELTQAAGAVVRAPPGQLPDGVVVVVQDLLNR
jgi:hypothetical protein